MEKRSFSINLLKKQKDFLNRFVDWALTIGRLLVIITEIIALSAFLYRFSLDRQIIDLHSKIKQQQSIVNLLGDNETAYRNLQDRLALISSLKKAEPDKIKIFKDITSAILPEIDVSNITVNENKITISIFAQNTQSLEKFTNSLKNYAPIKKINLDNIQIKPASGLIVGFTAEF